ncbi:glucose/quinate/shikimate family membrane-bound PQQ-dependent dehydrogenase [Phenylobacterium sp.]|uniref:glucose/quinate/shikimate family membrane-bound PQQ-dependent dehydrogenase n=1 Tax=Phenylobacterium sp. TaxID=1871053 RepID=UPI003BA8EDE3
MATEHTPRAPLAAGALLGLVGLAMGVGGAQLIALGGSWYYLIAGLAVLASGVLLAARKAEALWLFAAVVLGTLVWAVWEIGLDWWPLAARGDVIFVLGGLLLLPLVTRPLGGRRAWAPLAGALGLAAVVGVAALISDEHEVAGRLPGPRGPVAVAADDVPAGDWTSYGRTGHGDRYSPLTQITPDNASRLKVAWTYRTGDLQGPGDPTETTFELTPLKVGSRVYICTPHDWAIALDAATGKPLWRYDPKIAVAKNLQHLTCRGVSYHRDAVPGGACGERIFLPTADARLIALDASTGKPCAGFGQGGAVDLWTGMPERQHGFYYSTSPPVVTKDLVIIAGEVTDNYSTREPSGVVRAYDVRTGALVWNWDAGNPDQTAPIGPGHAYTRNSPNSWGVSSVDETLGLIYLPMGNQTPDQFGGHRQPTPERFNSAVVALDVATGKLRWVFQTVHHDLWDMDIGGQPSLVDIDTPSGRRPALVASTKRGDIYVLDRATGAPIIPVVERAVPRGAAPGDRTSPTQPFSALTFLPKRPLEGRDMWGVTLFDQLVCRIRFAELRYDGIFTPPSVKGSLVYPGNFGVFDWGGLAVDPARQVAFANPDYFAFVSKLIPRRVGEGGGTRPLGASSEGGGNPMYGAPYAVELHPLTSPLGLPCQAPPWGYVAGVDLVSGKIAWMHRNGTVRDSSPVPLPFKMGVPSLGGPIMTAGGVAFLTGTLDRYIRAYDVTTGRQLWQARLPAGAQTTPMTYATADGRQIVLTAAGGHGSLGTKMGDYLVAYALPRS